MKNLFLLVVVLAALTVFCPAALAQYGYVIPTLQTVRRDGSTVNVYTYRDVYGNKIRETEYYVNDDGSYGNLDVYFGSQGLAGFTVRTDYKNGVCTMSEQSTSYSADGSATVNSRETTFNPDGKVNVLTYNTRELENKTTVITGMETDGFGRKVGDFMEERWKDADNNDISRRTVYNPDKTVNITHRTENRDGTEIRMERTYDENDRELDFSYIELDKEGNEVYFEGGNSSYIGDGNVRSENIIVDRLKGTQLHYFEEWHEFGSTSTAEGELLDKDGKKLADYSFEKTMSGDGSEVRVDTYIYPNGKVDIISKTVDADGNITINKQLDFKAAGEETGETPDDDIDYDALYNFSREKLTNDNDEPDDEVIRYFEDISDVWGENIVETGDGLGSVLNEELDEVLDDWGVDNSGTGNIQDEENNETGEDDDEIDDVPGEENDEVSGDNDGAGDVQGEDNDGNNGEVNYDGGSDNGVSYDTGSDAGSSYDGGSDNGGSYDWGSDAGSSYDGGSYDGGSDDGGWDD